MHEGRVLLEGWARALEGAPLPELVACFAGRKQIEELSGPSGANYVLTLEGLWERGADHTSNDFYLLLSLRPSQGWRRFKLWRANLVATRARKGNQMNPILWVQRAHRERER